MQGHGFKSLIGGLHAAVMPYNRADHIHRSSLGSLLGDIINYEAKVHDAPFDRVGFRNVLRMLAKGKAEVLFFPAAWDACIPHIVGATFNFRSLFLERKGSDIGVKHGLYTEDVSLLLSKLRDLLSERPHGGKMPEPGLGQFFEEESLRHFTENGLSGGVFPSGRIFEFMPGNTKIIRIQNELGAELGVPGSSGLFRGEGLTPEMKDRLKLHMPVGQFDIIMPNGKADPDNFVVGWQSWNGAQKIYSGFTNGMSTYQGTGVTQCQVVTNGNLPRAIEIESVLASSVAVAEEKIRAEWEQPQNIYRPAPSLPIWGANKEVWEAAFAMSGEEIAAQVIRAANDTETVRPTHYHIHNEPEVLEAMHNLKVGKRMLGPHEMQTGRINLSGRLGAAGNAQKARSRLVNSNGEPFKLVA